MLSLQHTQLLRRSGYRRSFWGVLSALLLSACSSGALEDPISVSGEETAVADSPVSVPSQQPANDQILDDQAYAVVTVIPATQLTVAYQSTELQDTVSADYVSRQWELMSSCLAVGVTAPQILIVNEWLARERADDVLFSITGRRIAAYVYNEGSLDRLTVSRFDFDGSQGVAGFHLRSIIGRYLWSLSGRPARDYDTTCAS